MSTTDTTPATATADPAPFALTADELPPVLAGDLALADVTPTLTLGDGFARERNGKPCFYFDKEAIGPGTIRDARGVVHNLTPKDADDIVADVSRAMSFGHEPSLPDRHFGTPGRNFGWVKGIRKNARGNIVLTHQHVGEAENNDALNLKTSVMLRRNYTDERGRHWRWWLDHNAVIPNPQLRDLEDFKPATLAASSDGQPGEVDYVVLAAQPQPAVTPPGETPMDWTKIRDSMGDAAKGDDGKDVPDDKMHDHVCNTFKKHKKALATMAMSADAVAKLRGAFTPESLAGKSDDDVMVLAADAIPSLNGKLQEAIGKVRSAEQARDDAIALSAEQAPEPEMDPRVRTMLAEGVSDARQMALDAGAPKGLVDELDGLFNEGGNPTDIALSATGPQSRPLGRQVYRAVAVHMKDVIATHNTIPRGATVARPAAATVALSGEKTDAAVDDADPELVKLRELYNLPSA